MRSKNLDSPATSSCIVLQTQYDCSYLFPTAIVQPGGNKEKASMYCVRNAEQLCPGPINGATFS